MACVIRKVAITSFSLKFSPLIMLRKLLRMRSKIVLFVVLSTICYSRSYVFESELLYDSFPDDFLWGVATAAYQVKA